LVGNVRGSVVGVFDSDGHLQARYEYDMWGNHRVLDAEGNVTTDPNLGNINAWRWGSEYYDVESGLYYAGGRYYDPRVGVVINAGADNADMSGGYAYDEVNPYEVFPASILTKSWWSPQEYAPSWTDVRRSSSRWNWWQWAMVVGGMAAIIVLTKGAGKMLLLKMKKGKIGFHATKPESAKLIKQGGFRESTFGRAGGGGVYINKSKKGALAEYWHHNPNGPIPEIIRVKYTPGKIVQIYNPGKYIHSPLPIQGDTLMFESLRKSGTFNMFVRNGTIIIL